MNKTNNEQDYGQATVDALNKSSIDSTERSERYEKIYAVERSKWPYNMGNMMRDEIPKELHEELDRCITNSQAVARDACQTAELTATYLKEN